MTNTTTEEISEPGLHLVVQLYKARSEELFRRMCESLERNLALGFIKQVTVLAQNIKIKSPNPKVKIIHTKERGTYGKLLKLAANCDRKKISHFALANTDIFLTDTIESLAKKISNKNSVAALTRHELDGRLHPRPMESQDFWLFAAHDPTDAVIDACDFKLGFAGCEHLFAMTLYTKGYDIWNPCIDCVIYHNDPKPRYDFEDRYSGAYLLIPPCKLEDVGTTQPSYKHSVARLDFQPGRPMPEVPFGAKLHLCCGDKKIDGFLGVDIRRDVQPDIVASLEDLEIFPPASISEVYFCHGPEHLSQENIEKCIRDIRRMMIPGGTFRLAMPDFEALVSLYVKGIVSLAEIRPALYGGQEYPENTHFSAWDFKGFSDLLTRCGFSEIERYNPVDFLPPKFFDYSLHQLQGHVTSLNIKCRALDQVK